MEMMISQKKVLLLQEKVQLILKVQQKQKEEMTAKGSAILILKDCLMEMHWVEVTWKALNLAATKD